MERRQDRRHQNIIDDDEWDLGDYFDDQTTLIGFDHGRGGRGGVRDVYRRDGNLGSIKMKIPAFQGKNDPEAYLE